MPLFEGIGYGGEKNAVIVDIGTAYTKCGFAGENGPRSIIPSEVKRPRTGQNVNVYSCKEAEDLYGVLVDFIHTLYFRHLLVNPKERRVVICESILCPSVFRNTLAKVLFQHYEVPSLLFAPSHLVALFTLGIPTGLVLDSGYTETLVLPVFEGIPILKAWQAIPLAAQAIQSQLEAKLLESATVTTEQLAERPLSSITNSINNKILEDIKVRCLFVTNLSRGHAIQNAKQGVEVEKAPRPPPNVDYPLDGGKILHIEGKIRENTCEVLFEQDNEERSVATLILDAILKSPVDMRRPLAENIVLCGGTCMLPGFRHRLMTEVKDLLNKPKYSQELSLISIKLHEPPAKDNYVAWLGASIFGALEVLSSRSISREAYQQNSIIPDWSYVSGDIEETKEDSSLFKR